MAGLTDYARSLRSAASSGLVVKEGPRSPCHGPTELSEALRLGPRCQKVLAGQVTVSRLAIGFRHSAAVVMLHAAASIPKINLLPSPSRSAYRSDSAFHSVRDFMAQWA